MMKEADASEIAAKQKKPVQAPLTGTIHGLIPFSSWWVLRRKPFQPLQDTMIALLQLFHLSGSALMEKKQADMPIFSPKNQLEETI